MAHDNHATHHVNYLAVFFVLCGCTALSVAFDILKFEKPVTIVLVLAVAVAKAMCVMMFFMHLKFEGNWKYVLLAPTTILAIGLPLALMPDIGVPYYTSTAPQRGAWADEVHQFHEHEHAAAPDAAQPAPSEPAEGAPAATDGAGEQG